MIFENTLKLKLTYVRANEPADDETVRGYIGTGGSFPQDAYSALKGSAADMTWPQGSSLFLFDVPDPKGPNLITTGGYAAGVRSWVINVQPCRVSGRLEIAYYYHDNLDDADPDSISTFDLGSGAWDTGDLPIYTGDGSSDFYRQPRIRFVPAPLIGPLGI